MEHFKKLVHPNHNHIILVFWANSFLLILFDTLFNYSDNPLWMTKSNVLLLVLMLLVLVVFLLKKVDLSPLFVVFAYVFTCYIYFPVFVGSEELGMKLLSNNVRFAACLFYVALVALLSFRTEALVLGALNVMLILLAIGINRFVEGGHLSIDPLVYLFFIVVSLTFYFLVWIYDKNLKENKQQEAALEKIWKTSLKEKVDDEAMRNTYLILKVEESFRLVEMISGKLSPIVNEPHTQLYKPLFQQITKECKHYLQPKTLNDTELLYNELDAGFANWLKTRYPGLNAKKLVMCCCLVMGMPTKAIAEKLLLGAQSIKKYRNQIRRLLGVPSNQSLTKRLEMLHQEYVQSKQGLF